MWNKTILMFLMSFFCLPMASLAYETIDVKNGGSIEGAAEFIGTAIPQDKTFTVSSEAKYCGKTLRTEKYLIDPEGKIKNVVVYLRGIKSGKAIPDQTVSVSEMKCAFVPHVALGFTGNKFVAKNEDPVLHTIHVYASVNGRTLYSIGLPEQGADVKKTLKRSGAMELNCDCHPWMVGYVFILDHPYAALTDERGAFTIENIPPGTYTVEAWHEALGTVKLEEVKVENGKASKIKVRYTSGIKLN